MHKMSEAYEARVQPFIDEQNRILNILTTSNPYKNYNWRKGQPERKYENGYDVRRLREEDVEEHDWAYNVGRDFVWCLSEFKWQDDWVGNFEYTIDRMRNTMRSNTEEIKTLDYILFQTAKREWEEADAEWIANEKLRKEHAHHKPKAYYIEWFAKDKDAEQWYKGVIPDNEDTCKFCIMEKKQNEEYEERMRVEREELERLRREEEEEDRRLEEERRKNQKPIELKEHKCEHCNYKTMYEAVFRVHLMSKEHKQNEKQQNLYCKACDHQCRGKIEYEHHLGTTKHKKNAGIISAEPTNYTCEACNYTTQFKHHYENHLKSKKHLKASTQEVEVPTTE